MDRREKYYFLGIGGIGMSALARYLNFLGAEVGGYDRTKSPLTIALEQEGIAINYEDKAENVPEDVDLVVFTPAVPENSEQMQRVKALQLPLLKRSQLLGKITENKKVLAVAGTHGKTTTCGMIAHILSCSSVGCSAFLGGILKSRQSNFFYNANSDYVVVEADEYDRSFLNLKPFASVVTSIDPDHLDIYHNYSNLHKAFEDFAMLTNKDGMFLVKSARSEMRELMHDKCFTQTYSLSDANASCKVENVRVEEGTYFFDYCDNDFILKNIEMNYPGRHNIENMLAAIAVCNFVMKKESLSIEQREKAIREGVRTFSGMQRRLDYILKDEKHIFIDDYAHHPEEISATISSLREMYPTKHFTGVFQPHLYSRTKDLAEGFANSLDLLDTAILLPIYPARELPIEGVSSEMIVEQMHLQDKHCVAKQELYSLLQTINPEFLITFGAGDIDRMLQEIAKTLQQL